MGSCHEAIDPISVMRHKNRCSTSFERPTHNFVDKLDCVDIKRRVRFVEEQKFRGGHEHSCKLGATQHAVATAVRTPICGTTKTDRLQCGKRRGVVETSGICHEHEVLLECEFGIEAWQMPNVSDPVPDVVPGRREEVCSQNRTCPTRGRLQRREQSQQRRLASAVRTKQAQSIPGFERERHVPENVNGARANRDPFKIDKQRDGRHRPEFTATERNTSMWEYDTPMA